MKRTREPGSLAAMLLVAATMLGGSGARAAEPASPGAAATAESATPSGSVVERARELATTGHRTEANRAAFTTMEPLCQDQRTTQT